MTDSTGTLLSQSRYLPFGQVRTDVGTITQTDFGYTGQRNLDAQGRSFTLGLLDYHARFYDPGLGRWTQPDSIVPDGNPQSLNRLSYSGNNPINFNDPTGHRNCEEDDFGCPGSPAYPPPNNVVTNPSAPNPCQIHACGSPATTIPTDPTVSSTPSTVNPSTLKNLCGVNYPCWESWQTPTSWDLNPNDPDYIVFNGSYSIFTVSVEEDRYGMWYVGGGISIDVLSTFFKVPFISIRNSHVNGYGGIYQKFPDPANMEKFLSEWSINGGGGILGGGSVTWAPDAGKYVSHTSTELGAYFPGSLGVSATYTQSTRQIQEKFNAAINYLKIFFNQYLRQIR